MRDGVQLEGWLKGNIFPFVRDGFKVVVALLQPRSSEDREICKAVQSCLNGLGVYSDLYVHSDPMATISMISSCDFVFSDRLHGAIISHAASVPFRLSIHHKKCVDFLDDIMHPDRRAGSYSQDWNGDGVFRSQEWILTQQQVIKRHADISNAGISNWLDHLSDIAL